MATASVVIVDGTPASMGTSANGAGAMGSIEAGVSGVEVVVGSAIAVGAGVGAAASMTAVSPRYSDEGVAVIAEGVDRPNHPLAVAAKTTAITPPTLAKSRATRVSYAISWSQRR